MYVEGKFVTDDMGLARKVSSAREELSRQLNLRHSAGATPTDEESHYMGYIGCLGESAVAKYLEIPWSESNGTFVSVPDVDSYDVRASDRHSNNLIIRPRDRDDKITIFVTIEDNGYRIHGWIRNEEAKQEKYLRAPNNRPAAYFVPRSDLHSMDTLPKE